MPTPDPDPLDLFALDEAPSPHDVKYEPLPTYKPPKRTHYYLSPGWLCEEHAGRRTRSVTYSPEDLLGVTCPSCRRELRRRIYGGRRKPRVVRICVVSVLLSNEDALEGAADRVNLALGQHYRSQRNVKLVPLEFIGKYEGDASNYAYPWEQGYRSMMMYGQALTRVFVSIEDGADLRALLRRAITQIDQILREVEEDRRIRLVDG